MLAGEIASVILVVLGIAGELGIGILSSNANTQLRTLNNSRLQLVREKATAAIAQAGNAETSARQASEAAASATLSSKQARDTAREAERVAANARKEADSFEKDIKSAKADAA